MGDLGAIEEDVPFDFAAATTLATACDNAATAVDWAGRLARVLGEHRVDRFQGALLGDLPHQRRGRRRGRDGAVVPIAGGRNRGAEVGGGGAQGAAASRDRSGVEEGARRPESVGQGGRLLHRRRRSAGRSAGGGTDDRGVGAGQPVSADPGTRLGWRWWRRDVVGAAVEPAHVRHRRRRGRTTTCVPGRRACGRTSPHSRRCAGGAVGRVRRLRRVRQVARRQRRGRVLGRRRSPTRSPRPVARAACRRCRTARSMRR